MSLYYDKDEPKKEGCNIMTEQARFNLSWLDSANCKNEDAELFYPKRNDSVAIAKEICHRCIVIQECLNYAIEIEDDHGILGGTTPSERKRLTRRPSARRI